MIHLHEMGKWTLLENFSLIVIVTVLSYLRHKEKIVQLNV